MQFAFWVTSPSFHLCPNAGTSVCATSTSLQTEQCFPSVFPFSVHVGSTASSITSVCPVAGTTSFFVAPQFSRVQVYVFSPAVVQVGAVVSSPSFHACPNAGTSVCATSTSLQTEQCFPSVFPFSVHVGSTASSITSVWPVAAIPSVLVIWHIVQVKVLSPFSVQVAPVVISPSSQLWSIFGISFCSSMIYPHWEHFFPAVNPVSVQVACLLAISVAACSVKSPFSVHPSFWHSCQWPVSSFDHSLVQLCPVAGISCVFVSLQTLQV